MASTTQNLVHRRYEASLRLREKSFLVWIIERVFRFLQLCSPASHFESSRTTDYYIYGWIAIGLSLALLSFRSWPIIPHGLVWLLLVFPILRILDIVQVAVNVGIFDQLGTEYQEVDEVTRSLGLLLINYIELMGWFGLIYLTCELENVSQFFDVFYFSVVTQLTVGYGDIKPLHMAKAVAGVQATLGWTITILILARFISSLPRIRKKGNGTGTSDPPGKKEIPDHHSAVSRPTRSVLPFVSIIISVGALFFAAQTYYVAHRPYVGLVQAEFIVLTDAKKSPIGGMTNFVVKNTGSSPALITTQKHIIQLTKGDRVVTLPKGGPQGSILMMPNQTYNLRGQFTDASGYAKLADVLDGTILLTVDIELRYTAIGWFWWKNNFVYRSRNRFRHDYVPPAFMMESGYAN